MTLAVFSIAALLSPNHPAAGELHQQQKNRKTAVPAAPCVM
jgi:hypothetical protein